MLSELGRGQSVVLTLQRNWLVCSAVGWVSEIQTREEMHDIVAKLRGWRAESERAGEPFGICAALRDGFTAEHYREMEDLGVTQLITVPWLLQGMTEDDVEKKCEAIASFANEFIR